MITKRQIVIRQYSEDFLHILLVFSVRAKWRENGVAILNPGTRYGKKMPKFVITDPGTVWSTNVPLQTEPNHAIRLQIKQLRFFAILSSVLCTTTCWGGHKI